jgi:hypothetical protein
MSAPAHRSSAVSLHVLPTAATMIGVCMTVITIVKLTAPGTFRHLADRLLGVDGVVFLFSVALSYGALRSPRRAEALERWADYAFLCGIAMMAIVGLIVAFELL